MITGTIIGKRRLGSQVFVQYSLTDGTDGEFEVAIGQAVSEINLKLQVIVDAANYADSLKTLIGSTVVSTTILPDPAKVISQFVADQVITAAGGSVDMAINLLNGQKAISGFQLTVVLPAGLTLTKAVVGKSAGDAAKTLSQNGNVLLVAGLNQTVIADGQVLVLTLAVGSIAPGAYLVSFINGASTDPSGKSIAAMYIGNAVKVG